MEYNPVVWFEIYVEDMKRAKAFYEALLAIALEPAKMVRHGYVDLPDG